MLAQLQVISIQMASSGVLLMLSADYSGSIYSIRSRFQACIPGGCSRRRGKANTYSQRNAALHLLCVRLHLAADY